MVLFSRDDFKKFKTLNKEYKINLFICEIVLMKLMFCFINGLNCVFTLQLSSKSCLILGKVVY